ncbi:hypothetical protein BT63DRAFT_479718 [Microthyrium microscopicum]|uniref:HIT-type domain-containing protein n=1 Tax=Microthyrium microscopicum TaxID=703497 RepID=A0A6A6U9M5_9PEZI|nr:hypothetical protein BT63DRAFT_479718 [Microthyrium microscopicum]
MSEPPEDEPATNTTQCTICDKPEPKYKCPHCEIRYCSIPCFKTHISTAHDSPDPNTTNATTDPSPAKNAVTTNTPSVALTAHPSPQPRPISPTTTLLTDPRLIQLLTRYPTLKPTLRTIYQTTVHPERLLDEHSDDSDVDEDALKRTWGGADYKRWTQERADEKALNELAEISKEDEGVAEFFELARIIFAQGDEMVKEEAD